MNLSWHDHLVWGGQMESYDSTWDILPPREHLVLSGYILGSSHGSSCTPCNSHAETNTQRRGRSCCVPSHLSHDGFWAQSSLAVRCWLGQWVKGPSPPCVTELIRKGQQLMSWARRGHEGKKGGRQGEREEGRKGGREGPRFSTTTGFLSPPTPAAICSPHTSPSGLSPQSSGHCPLPNPLWLLSHLEHHP